MNWQQATAFVDVSLHQSLESLGRIKVYQSTVWPLLVTVYLKSCCGIILILFSLVTSELSEKHGLVMIGWTPKKRRGLLWSPSNSTVFEGYLQFFYNPRLKLGGWLRWCISRLFLIEGKHWQGIVNDNGIMMATPELLYYVFIMKIDIL